MSHVAEFRLRKNIRMLSFPEVPEKPDIVQLLVFRHCRKHDRGLSCRKGGGLRPHRGPRNRTRGVSKKSRKVDFSRPQRGSKRATFLRS